MQPTASPTAAPRVPRRRHPLPLVAGVGFLFAAASPPVAAHNPQLDWAAANGVVAPARPIGAAAEPADAGPDAIDFALDYVDTAYGGNGKPGWVRSADLDADGDLDIVAAGGDALFVYENDGSLSPGSWPRWGDLSGNSPVGANGGALVDVDGDGSPDVVSAIYESTLGWWRNPGPPLGHGSWSFSAIEAVPAGFYLHDLIVVDLDRDGRAEEFVANFNAGYWNATILIRWYRRLAGGGWEAHTVEPGRAEGPAHGHAGLDVADLDGDGDRDLVYANGWYESSGSPTGPWTWHAVSDVYGISNSLARDLNADGRPDLVVSAGHHGQGVFWLEQPASNPGSAPWTRHPISTVDGDVTARWFYDAGSQALHHPESLAVLDIDFDGDLDVVTSDLYFGEDPGEPDWSDEVHNVYVYQNAGTFTTPAWVLHNIAPDSYPSHLLQATDLNQDGAMDFISEAAGHSVVSFHENLPEPGSLLLLASGALLLLGLDTRRRRRALAALVPGGSAASDRSSR